MELNGNRTARNKNRRKKTKKRGTTDHSDGAAAKSNKNPKADETEKPRVVSLAEAAAKLDPSDLADYLDVPIVPDIDLLRFYFYFGKAFTQVSFPWVKMLKDSPLSTLIDVPLSHISTPLYEFSVDWIKERRLGNLKHIVFWLCDRILDNLASGGDNAPASYLPKSQAGHFVVLAMVLRARPDSLIEVLPSLRDEHMYQGPDKLPLFVWMMAQASLGDLSTGLYSWMCNLLPLVSNNKCCPQSMDLVLQLAEYILSRPEALTILVNGGGVMEGKRKVPLPSLGILLRLTFPAPSAIVETTKRFEAIYPLLKEVALSPEWVGGRYGMNHLFSFALTLTGEKRNHVVLTKEATSIAIRSLVENVCCFDHWDKLYMDDPEACVALLKKLVDDNHFLRLSSSQSDIFNLTVNQTMKSFRRKNKRAIAEGGANCSLYKEADKYCTLISWRLFWRLSLVSCGLNMTAAVVITAASAAAVVAAKLLYSL